MERARKEKRKRQGYDKWKREGGEVKREENRGREGGEAPREREGERGE